MIIVFNNIYQKLDLKSLGWICIYVSGFQYKYSYIFLNMTGFWMCVGMQLWKGSEYCRIPSISYFIVQNSPPAPFLKGGIWKKIKKGVEVWCKGRSS